MPKFHSALLGPQEKKWVGSVCSLHTDENSTETLFTYPELSSYHSYYCCYLLPHSIFKLLTLGVIIVLGFLSLQ